MKALTVQQPWAWSIVYGGKDVENRTTAWKYRGPLAIHAGTRWSDRGVEHWEVRRALESSHLGYPADDSQTWASEPATSDGFVFGAIIGVVQLVDLHGAGPYCCESPWRERQYVEHGGKLRRQLVHLVLKDARPVQPIECVGRLGLWTPELEVLEQLKVMPS